MKVDIERLKFLQDCLNEINSVPLEEIELYENGIKVEIPKDEIEKWKFIGLNNTTTISTLYIDKEVFEEF